MNAVLLSLTEEALSRILPMAADGWAPAQSIERQLRFCFALAADAPREEMPGAFTLGLIATREMDMWGDQPELASLINRVQAEAERELHIRQISGRAALEPAKKL
jgi:hypothetical protein